MGQIHVGSNAAFTVLLPTCICSDVSAAGAGGERYVGAYYTRVGCTAFLLQTMALVQFLGGGAVINLRDGQAAIPLGGFGSVPLSC